MAQITQATKKLMEDIGLRISKKRKEIGLTQEQLAEKMDVSIQMISNLEHGNKAIRIDNLINLCQILDVSTDYILTGKEAPPIITNDDLASLSERDRKMLKLIIAFCSDSTF